ncbi:MAG: YIP1 family protein [Gemmatimonadales bacterium]
MSSPTPASTPVPTPPSGGIPIVSDAVRLLRVLISPGAVFAEIEQRPTFWGPFAVVAILNVVINYFQQPFNQRIGQIMTERAGRPFTEPTAVRTAISAVLGGTLGPLILCLLVGGVLYVLVSVFGGQTTYKKMITVSIFTWPVTLIQLAVTNVVLASRGVASINGPQDLFVSLGADLLLAGDTQIGVFPRLLLAGIGPLPIWKLTLTAVGLMVMGKLDKNQGWTAAIIIFVLAVLMTATIGALSMKMMGG